MADQYRHVDPSDAAKALNGFSPVQYKDIDPSDVAGVIKDNDPNVKDVDRSDAVPLVNELIEGGGEVDPPPEVIVPDPVAVLSLWNTNPALVVVGTADIGKFVSGDVVTMAGVQDPYAFVNGQQTVGIVGEGEFELVGVDLTAAMSTISGAGVTVTPAAPPAARSSRRSSRAKKAR